jgi:hypothetical protein
VQAYGYELPKDIEYVYTHVRKTHNTGVFDAYTDEMKRARKSGILTGGCCAMLACLLCVGGCSLRLVSASSFVHCTTACLLLLCSSLHHCLLAPVVQLPDLAVYLC